MLARLERLQAANERRAICELRVVGDDTRLPRRHIASDRVAIYWAWAGAIGRTRIRYGTPTRDRDAATCRRREAERVSNAITNRVGTWLIAIHAVRYVDRRGDIAVSRAECRVARLRIRGARIHGDRSARKRDGRAGGEGESWNREDENRGNNRECILHIVG